MHIARHQLRLRLRLLSPISGGVCREGVTFNADVSHQLLAICIQQNRMQMTQCKVIHVPLAGPPPFALAMHLKCNQRKPKPKQTLLPHRASQASQEPTASSQPTYQPTARQATSTLLSNELRCESRSIVRKCHSVGGNKNAFGKLQKFPLFIGFASQLD